MSVGKFKVEALYFYGFTLLQVLKFKITVVLECTQK
jgi:hypothetical protein